MFIYRATQVIMSIQDNTVTYELQKRATSAYIYL